ncbi:MAG: arylamine N-acetyltransferase [Clostridiales bacterium]|nr:arylamine N-acetyltransferase [Clostridiales bacterium]
MYTIEQLTAAFDRIGLIYDPDAAPTPELLSDVQYAMATHVPYENLDIVAGIPLSLDYGDLYDKIVTRHRGGYCFELNGFLGELLRSLGYGIVEVMARYLRGEVEIPMRRHRVLLAEASDGSRWIADAGIGQAAFKRPLRFEEGAEAKIDGETYRVGREPFFGWVISDWHDGAWRKFYSFTEEVQLNIDYIMPSFWCEHAPESPFPGAPMLSIKTADGRITVDGDMFRIWHGEIPTEKRIGSEVERAEIYRTYFGIGL